MVAGKLIFGFILGSIASTLANLDAQRVLFEEKLNALKVSKNNFWTYIIINSRICVYIEVHCYVYVQHNFKISSIACLWLQVYMKQQNLSSSVQNRVLNFFDYLWIRNKGTDPQVLLEDMPYCMQSEVSLATTESLIKQVNFHMPSWQLIGVCIYWYI